MVSGRATVIGYTVNHHQWHPDFDAALRDRRGGPGRGSHGPADHHDRGSATRRRSPSARRWPSASSTTRTCGSRSSSRPVSRRPATRWPNPSTPCPGGRSATTASSTAPCCSGVGRSALGRRLMVDPLSSDRRRLPPGGGRRRTRARRTSTDCRPTRAPAGMGMSEGGVTAVEEALRLHPTWINGGGELPGPGGAVVAAMLAVASGLCRHVLCFRTVWESSFAALRLGGPGGATLVRVQSAWRAPFGALSAANWIAMNANQYLHRYGATREMLGLIALNGRANAARNPGGHLPGPDDHGRLPVGPARSPPPSGSTTATSLRRIDRRRRVGRVGGRRSPATGHPHRGGRNPDPRTGLLGPGDHHPRAPGARPGGAPVVADRPAAGRRRPGPALRRLHLQCHLLARGPRILRLRGSQRLARPGSSDRPRRRSSR